MRTNYVVTEHGKLNKFFDECKQNKEIACRKYFINEESILEIVYMDITTLEFVPDNFKSLELYRKASEMSPYTYFYVPKKYKDDAVILMHCLKSDGLLLQYCSDDIKRNKQFIRVAVRSNPYAIKYAASELLEDKSFCKDMVSFKDVTIKYFPSFWNDKEIMYPLCRYHREYLKYITEDMQKEIEKLYFQGDPVVAVKKLFPSFDELSWEEEVARIAATSKFGCMFSYNDEE